jgi:Xaa-Pro aminopeptidase
VSEPQKKPSNRARPITDELRAFIAEDWAPRAPGASGLSEAARYAAARRDAVSAAFTGERLIVPAGGLKVRSNDTDYVFRPHSAFAHLTGLGGDREPDAVLVLEPRDDDTHEAVLYFRPLSGRNSDEFFTDTRYGEFWVGARPTLEDVETELGVTARHLDEFADAAVKDAGEVTVRLVRDADWDLTRQLDEARSGEDTRAEELQEADDELAHFLSHLRLLKDEWEVQEMRRAIAATHMGFEAVIADLPDAVA